MNKRSEARCWKMPLMGCVLALLTTPAFAAAAEAEEGVQWGEWKAGSNGYLLRRKQPPKLESPIAERYSTKVQERLPKLKQLEKRLQKELRKQDTSPQEIIELEDQLVVLDARISIVEMEAVFADVGEPVTSLWFRTASEGLHGITVSDLAVEMNQTSKNLRRLADKGWMTLTNKGAPVSWHFDATADAIFFAAETYDTFYSSENAYHLRIGDKKNGWPMQVSGKKPAKGLNGAETAFRDTLKFEEEPDMNFVTWAVKSEPDADYWFWDYLYGGYKDTIDVDLFVPNPAAQGQAQLRIRLRGWTNLVPGDEHEVSAELNGIPLGIPVVWDGFDEAMLVINFDQLYLDAFGSNTLTLSTTYDEDTHPGQFLDDIELDYQRLPVSVNDQLWLHDVVADTQTVSGFSSEAIMVIESPAGEAVLRKDVQIDFDGIDSYQVTFEAGVGKDYLMVAQSAMETPALAMDHQSGLNEAVNRADYLIIAPRNFTATAEALAAYRGSNYGKVKIAWLDDIYNQFSHGLEEPQAIKQLMQSAALVWELSPTAVVLLGKGSLDHKDRMAYSDSFVPTLMTSTPWTLSASDERLLAGEDAAQFVIGRLPITNDAEGLAYVDKLITYESATPGAESSQALLVADNSDSAGDFHANSDALATRLVDTLGFNGVSKLYHPDDAVRSNLIESAAWETGYVSYDGHGSVTQVGDSRESFIKVTDAELLSNSTLPLFTALTCAAGDFTMPGTRSLAGALVLNPAGGAMSALAPTGLSLDDDAQVLGDAFVDSLFNGDSIGDALRDSKSLTQGEVRAFMPRIYSVVGDPVVYAR
ncbi:MAG: hypothetical protein ACI9H8_001763 [Lysobacterales bacterium]|jgi:hypothetical protein